MGKIFGRLFDILCIEICENSPESIILFHEGNYENKIFMNTIDSLYLELLLRLADVYGVDIVHTFVYNMHKNTL